MSVVFAIAPALPLGKSGKFVAGAYLVDQPAERQNVQLLTNHQRVWIGEVVFPDNRLVGHAELLGDGAYGVARLDHIRPHRQLHVGRSRRGSIADQCRPS